MVLILLCPSVVDLFLMREVLELRGIHWNIAKLVYLMSEVAYQIYRTKVQMRCHMDHVHTQVVPLIPITCEALAPVGQCHSRVALGWLISFLLSLFVNHGLCSFWNLKLEEHIFHLVTPVEIFLHIGFCLRGVPSVLCHQIDVDQCPDTVESIFEKYYFPAVGLAWCSGDNPKNILLQVPQLLPLPLSALAIGLLGTKSPG